MKDIIETRYSRINNKIILLKDIFKLANLIFKEYEEDKKQNNHTSISFTSDCTDESSFESESPSLFSDESIINTKRVNAIEIFFYNYEQNKKIIFVLSQRYGSDSYFKVSGNDSIWVNGISKKIEETINSFNSQSNFIRNNKIFFILLFGFSMGAIFINILLLLPIEPSKGPNPATLTKYIFKYLFGLLGGILPGSLLTDKLIKLYPNIEIQIGPEHTFIEKIRRKWLLNAFIIGVLPLLISVCYDVLKFFL